MGKVLQCTQNFWVKLKVSYITLNIFINNVKKVWFQYRIIHRLLGTEAYLKN